MYCNETAYEARSRGNGYEAMIPGRHLAPRTPPFPASYQTQIQLPTQEVGQKGAGVGEGDARLNFSTSVRRFDAPEGSHPRTIISV
jgi:hypothetical protein